MEAMTLRDARTCGCGCGQPVERAHHWDQEGAYEVIETVCWAGQALAAWHETNKDRRGVIPVVVESAPDRELRDLPAARSGARTGPRPTPSRAPDAGEHGMT